MINYGRSQPNWITIRINNIIFINMDFKKLISEGRYDSFTREIVKDIMVFIKETEGDLDDYNSFELPYETTGEDYYSHESGIEFEVDLRIKRTEDTITHRNRELPYHIHTYIADDDALVMEIMIDETYGRKFYQEMSYKINEDIRHEIEHYLQSNFKDRQQSNIPNTSDYETTFEHHMDPSEVEALVHGFYRRAKQEKKPLDVVMSDDIKQDIQGGNLTPDEGDTILKTLIQYAVKKLPKAQYSSSFRRRFIV